MTTRRTKRHGAKSTQGESVPVEAARESANSDSSTPVGQPQPNNGSNGGFDLDSALTLSSLRQLESILSSRSRFESPTSIRAFDGELDYFKVLGYPTTLTVEDYNTLYDRCGLAASFVEVLPKLAWVKGIYIQETEDVEERTAFEDDVNQLFKTHKIYGELFLADILRSLSTFSILLIGINDGLELDQPVNSTIPLDQLLYFTAYQGETQATIASKVTSPTDPRCGLPEFYNIALNESATRRVHYSRVIHIVDNHSLLRSRYLSSPVLRSVWNDFIGLYRVDDGGCLSQWRSATRTINWDIDPNLLKPPETSYAKQAKQWKTHIDELVAKTEEQLQEAERGLRPYAITSGATPNSIAPSVPAFSSNAEYKIKKIASRLGIPWRSLFGAEAGDLASTTDRDQLKDRKQEYIDNHADPTLRLVVDWLLEHKTVSPLTAAEIDDGYAIIWPKSNKLNETEISTIVDRIASVNQKQRQSGDTPYMSSDEMRDKYGDMEPLDGDLFTTDLDDDLVDELQDEERDPGLKLNSATEPEWKAVHRVADSFAGGLAKTVSELWPKTRSLIDINRLTRSVQASDNFGAEQVLRSAMEQAVKELDLESRLSKIYLQCLNTVAETMLRSARSKGGFLNSKARSAWDNVHKCTDETLLYEHSRNAVFSMIFNADNPRALSYALGQSSSLITQIIDVQLDASRQLIFSGISEGVAPRKLQQQIRKSIGLRSDQLTAIENLKLEMMSVEPGTVVSRFAPRPGVRKLAGFRAKVPKGPLSARQAWTDKQAARYTRMQENLRARTIGRSETLRAANQGQLELWQQAKENGVLPASVKRVWIDTGDEREREEHRQMAGQKVGLDEPFMLPGGTATEPGTEPNCRCTHGIVEG